MWNFKLGDDRAAALDDKGNKLTYGELAELSASFHDVAHRKLSFNMCSNSLGSLAGYASMIEGGTVPVMLSSDVDRELLASLLNTYEPDYMWISIELIKKEEEFFAQYLELTGVGTSCNAEADSISYSDYIFVKTIYHNSEPIYEKLALLLTTSGSTGSPKFVRQSYDNILANTESIVEYLHIDDKERPITTLPMNYTYGLSIINTHLFVGATILITDKTLMDRNFWNFFKSEKATSFGGVPYTYEILDKLRLTRMDLPSLKTMTQAGGKLSVELHEKLANYASETGREFVVMYGQTEATARMAYLPADMALEKIGSMGIAIPGGEFILADTEGQPISDIDVTGELIYKGRNVTLGYSEKRVDLSLGDERGGILETGDMAQRDKDGYFFIVGRKKRFLKMYGKRVNLDEVDRILKSRFNGVDFATTGVDDKMKIYAAFDMDEEELSKDSVDKNLDEIRRYIAEKMHINLSGITVMCIDKIPRSESGKVLYKELD